MVFLLDFGELARAGEAVVLFVEVFGLYIAVGV